MQTFSFHSSRLLIWLHHICAEDLSWTLMSPSKLATTSNSSLGSLLAPGDLPGLPQTVSI